MDNSFVAIVNFGLGNLFSVKQACQEVGLTALITSSKEDILKSAAVILPGVGAFGEAMLSLRRLDLIGILRESAASGKPFIGICLGMQLLMTRSFEFGKYEGLGLIDGDVVRLNTGGYDGVKLKVPHVGWSRICGFCNSSESWGHTLLNGVPDGTKMYFAHSYIVEPKEESLIISKTQYGVNCFCSSLKCRNISAFQFHPERSGPAGLKIYSNLASLIMRKNKEEVLYAENE